MKLLDLVAKHAARTKKTTWFEKIPDAAVKKDLLELKAAFHEGRLPNASMTNFYDAVVEKYPTIIKVARAGFVHWLKDLNR